MAERFSLIIIGAGSAGFAAASKANDLELKTVLINEGLLGGTCVNVGCVPSKYLLEVSRHLVHARNPVFDGINIGRVDFSFKQTMEEMDRTVEKLRQSNYTRVVDYLPHVSLIEGRAELLGERMVKVGRDHKTNKLVGGQVLSYNAAELIHELTMAVQYGLTINDIIGMAHVFPTMSEGVKKANQAFYRDVTTMSCCVE